MELLGQVEACSCWKNHHASGSCLVEVVVGPCWLVEFYTCQLDLPVQWYHDLVAQDLTVHLKLRFDLADQDLAAKDLPVQMNQHLDLAAQDLAVQLNQHFDLAAQDLAVQDLTVQLNQSIEWDLQVQTLAYQNHLLLDVSMVELAG